MILVMSVIFKVMISVTLMPVNPTVNELLILTQYW